MNRLKLLISLAVIRLLFGRCSKSEPDVTLNDFCAVAPEGWQCEIIRTDFNQNEIPQAVDDPEAIIKYTNVNDQCAYTIDDTNFSPSFILDVYPISKKTELLAIIRSQRMYSSCIPIYYGETPNYFIISSPCFIYGVPCGIVTQLFINYLQYAIKSLITVNDDGVD